MIKTANVYAAVMSTNKLDAVHICYFLLVFNAIGGTPSESNVSHKKAVLENTDFHLNTVIDPQLLLPQ